MTIRPTPKPPVRPLKPRRPIARVSAKKRKWTCAHCPTKNLTGEKKCSSCGIRRSTKRASLKARCDKMARELVKLRSGGRCERCGREAALDWAHIHRRAKHSVRWDPANALAMCRPCHTYTGDHPLEFSLWLVQKFGAEAMHDLERRANEAWDRSYLSVIASLDEQERRADEMMASTSRRARAARRE